MAHGASDCKDSWNSRTDPTCHTLGDVGADFYNAAREGSDYLREKWTIPSKDLSKIYAMIGYPDESPELIDSDISDDQS